ncbi:MAG: site-specific integrase [Microcoleus sp. PH2017_40_RAT_O_B]|uniref:tyrosine-type recombinase/integrase n=2 Tax=Microcoleus TaxID=44471 RepID=UPI001DE2AD15|nr:MULTISPECIES: site-specific integrase [unclassified Microcoleus]MCC3574318.1 site-specific integrase [Microcoleus sp. PH2017_34_RAT_O_A]MCC3611844.1 site-specific integrase [Microcoleus sp. PH2017_40_RAT_O_B]
MKIEGHGQAKILTQAEIELLFNEGLQTHRDRTLFGVCLYTACRVAEACSLEVVDIYTAKGNVRPTINFRKHNTKGKLQTRTIPVIEDLRSLLTAWKPNIGKTYLFPGRHRCHHWHHLHSNSADRILREAFERVGIEGASTHSFRRTALTQMSNSGIPLRVIQEISGHRNLEQLQRYLEVEPEQVLGAIASLSMLSYAGKTAYPHVQDELTAAPSAPLPPSQLSHTPEGGSSPKEILE